MGGIILDPTSIREQLLYTTVRIECLKGDYVCSVGTGFFYHCKLSEGRRIELIITNKHVLEDSKKLKFYFHEAIKQNNSKIPCGKSFHFDLDVSNYWVPHPKGDIDLGAILFKPIEDAVTKEIEKIIFRKSIDDTYIKLDSELAEIADVADNVLMIGYPNGLWDSKNNFPIVRKGIAASHPAVDYEQKSQGIVDIATFVGSSGSPILIVDEGVVIGKKGVSIGESRVALLGVLFEGAVYNSAGEIVITELPTKQKAVAKIGQMIHLGFYVKAKEIVRLCEYIKSRNRIL